MRKDRYDILVEILSSGYLDVDIENGVVTTPQGSNGSPTPQGRLKLTVYYNGKFNLFYISEIVAVAGGLNPIGATVDHIDNNKLNNRFDNLQILTVSDNVIKSALDGNYRKKLSVHDVIELKALHLIGARNIDLAERYNIGTGTTSQIVNGKRNTRYNVEVLYI